MRHVILLRVSSGNHTKKGLSDKTCTVFVAKVNKYLRRESGLCAFHRVTIIKNALKDDTWRIEDLHIIQNLTEEI